MAGDRGGSGPPPHHHLLAQGWRPLHHAAPGDHTGSPDGCAQRGDVPGPGPGAGPPCHALATPQGGCGPLAGDGGPGRAHARGHRAGGRSAVHLLRLGAAAAQHRRVHLRRVPAQETGGAGPSGHQRSPGAGPGRDRDRGLHRPGGAAGHGGSVRGSHGLLLPRRLLPRGARDGGDHAQCAGLPHHHRRASSHGGLLSGARHRADLPAVAEAQRARDRGLPHAGGGDLPQPRLRQHRQAVSRTGMEGDQRAVGHGPHVPG
jgi:hypothetical protein